MFSQYIEPLILLSNARNKNTILGITRLNDVEIIYRANAITNDGLGFLTISKKSLHKSRLCTL